MRANVSGQQRRQDLCRRGVDVVISCVALVACVPIILASTVLVRLFLGGPVFFSQQRVGRDGKLFVIFKFRTMKSEAYEGQPDYQRTTRFSRLIRALSLDELPQLLNIVRGDMSLIGPRPLPPYYLEHFSARHRDGRQAIRPGLTGWAQVKGRNALALPERFELDLWYIENRTLAVDAKIVVATIGLLIRPRGVVGPGGVVPWYPTQAEAEV